MMAVQTDFQDEVGVHPESTPTLTPRQLKFKELYLDVGSSTFGNCYQSAINAGFTNFTAKNLTHNKPKWYSEIVGQIQSIEPEHILLKLMSIVNNPNETTPNQLKALDMLMRHKGMYIDKTHQILELRKISIESILD